MPSVFSSGRWFGRSSLLKRKIRELQPRVERLEDREVLSTTIAGLGSTLLADSGRMAQPFATRGVQVAAPDAKTGETVSPALTPAAPVYFTPAQIKSAYGYSSISFGSVVGDGAGQTIAIVDAYDNPNIAGDLATFDTQFGIAAPPSFIKISQTGSTTALPGVDPTGGWEGEIALDVEWAHALAPKANILLVEANSPSYTDLFTAVNYARNVPGVSVVSCSWGGGEFSGETAYDTYFTTPTGHTGVTFVVSTGDSGAPAQYPAASPKVLAVGGTSLTLTTSNTYSSEKGWSGSGGGISKYEAIPTFQKSIVTQSRTKRTNPDVSLDADPNTGVIVLDTYNGGPGAYYIFGGTSFSAPAWGALVAIVDQGRVLSGKKTLDGATGTLPGIYSLPATDFHDVTTGSNGYAAKSGYDLVTGRGTPYADRVARDLVAYTSATANVITGTPITPTKTTFQIQLFGIESGVTTSQGDSARAFLTQTESNKRSAVDSVFESKSFDFPKSSVSTQTRLASTVSNPFASRSTRRV